MSHTSSYSAATHNIFYASYGQAADPADGKIPLMRLRRQGNFPQFLSNLSIAYTGIPLSNATLYHVS